MTSNQIKNFITLCQIKNFTKAAEMLYITQPALSRQITALEKELGTDLLERNSGKKFKLTKSGEKYFEVFSRFIEDVEYLDYFSKNFELNTMRTFEIAVMMGWHMPGLIAKCNEKIKEPFPECDVRFEFYDPATLNEKLKEGRIDIAVMIEPSYEPHPLYEKEFLCNIHSAFFVAAKNPAVIDGKIEESKLTGPFVTHIQMEKSRNNQFRYTEILSSQKLVIEEYHSLEAIGQKVLAGNGIALCDEWSTPFFSSDYAAKKLENYIIPIAFVCKKEKNENFQNMKNVIRACFEEWNTAK